MWTSILLILLCTSILAYAFWTVQPKKKGIEEGFALNVEPDFRTAINRTFNDVLGRDAQEFEIQNYRGTMTTINDVDKVVKKLEASSEYQRKVGKETFANVPPSSTATATTKTEKEKEKEKEKTAKDAELAKRLAIYRAIIRVYERVLDRLPNMKELNYYHQKMQAEPNFDLELLLKSSNEKKILEKNQTNAVNVDLDEQVTDAQLTLLVDQVYAETLPGKELPNREDHEFLKTRFVSYKLDRERLKRLILFLDSMDGGSPAFDISGDNRLGQVDSLGETRSGTETGAGTKTSNLEKKLDQDKKQRAAIQDVTTVAPLGHVKDANDIVLNMDDVALYGLDKDAVLASLMQQKLDKQANKNKNSSTNSRNKVNPQKDSKPYPPLASFATQDACIANKNAYYNKNKFYDSFYDANAKVQDCDISNVVKCGNTKDMNNALANIQNERNKRELEYQCDRNAFYLQHENTETMPYDPNIVPSKLNTKFGTFLADAADTQVGSILPKFIFKEYS
jgi:hypothetical protein